MENQLFFNLRQFLQGVCLAPAVELKEEVLVCSLSHIPL